MIVKQIIKKWPVNFNLYICYSITFLIPFVDKTNNSICDLMFRTSTKVASGC